MTFPSNKRLIAWTFFSLACLLAWDASRLDLPMAAWFGTRAGFALKEHWLFSMVLHEGARRVSWLIAIAICASIWWPLGPLRSVAQARRVQLAVTTLVSLLLISTIKLFSHTSCPWDLQQFGGVAAYVSHWAPGVLDGGGERCFPAGHASAAFAFSGLFFAFREQPRLALKSLAAVLVAGLVLGVSQQVRGAHYMSHTLWTGWLCWTTAFAAEAAVRSVGARYSPAPSPSAHAGT